MYFFVTTVVGFYQRMGIWMLGKVRERPVIYPAVTATTIYVAQGFLPGLLCKFVPLVITYLAVGTTWCLIFGPFIMVLALRSFTQPAPDAGNFGVRGIARLLNGDTSMISPEERLFLKVFGTIAVTLIALQTLTTFVLEVRPLEPYFC